MPQKPVFQNFVFNGQSQKEALEEFIQNSTEVRLISEAKEQIANLKEKEREREKRNFLKASKSVKLAVLKKFLSDYPNSEQYVFIQDRVQSIEQVSVELKFELENDKRLTNVKIGSDAHDVLSVFGKPDEPFQSKMILTIVQFI